jgi:glycosyltransferase involved in cell wall biosynthesis
MGSLLYETHRGRPKHYPSFLSTSASDMHGIADLRIAARPPPARFAIRSFIARSSRATVTVKLSGDAMEFVANGRMLNDPCTGQPRYFQEIASRIGPRLRIVRPPRGFRGIAGHLWEQSALAGIGMGNVLWSPGNTGPLALRRQVVTMHDTSMIEHPEWFSSRFAAWYNYVMPRLAKKVARILTVSEFSKQRIVELFGICDSRVRVAPNCVGPSFRPCTDDEVNRVREHYSLNVPYVLVVGSVQPRKNLGRLLRAWELVARDFPEYELVVAGGSSAVFANTGLGKLPGRVKFLGYVAERHLAPLYTGATLFCYPSLYEGFGLPPLEAMACGTPVVTSSSTSLPEVVGDAAVLVDPAVVESIADGVRRVLSNVALQARLRIAGRARAATFNWDQSAQQVWEVLNEAA